MRYTYLFLTVFVLGTTAQALASELDSEINDLQVRIVRLQPKVKARAKPAPKPQVAKQKPISPKIYSYQAAPAKVQTTLLSKPYYKATPIAAASASQTTSMAPVQTPVVADDYTPSPRLTSRPAPEQRDYEQKYIRRFELMPAFSATSFDGGDSTTLIPNGISPFTSSFLNAALRSDIDLGFAPFYLELGLQMTQAGASTGIGSTTLGYSTTTSAAFTEKETFTYLSVPINVKWRLAPQDHSALYFKAGLTPAFMMSHNYQSTTPVNDEYRFGAYNTFDIQVGGGLGFDLKISKEFHAFAEATFFQGLMPVMTNFSVYNYGFITGVGIAYLL